ncbi:MAG: VOC family protein [Planctomycetes bacterium]|nr:VOC family protein [Planctomycetota bacterium]
MAKKKASKKSVRKPAKKARPTRKQAPRTAKKTAAKAQGMPFPFNAITHTQIPAPNLAKAQAFYGKTFGWKFQAVPGMAEYVLFKDGLSGGGLNAFPGAVESGTQPYITVKDITSTMANVVAAGGSVVQEKCEIPGGQGFVAQFSDPNGIKIGLWSAS